jgi:hypothetical protein
MLLKFFWVVARRQFSSLKMGQTSDPETLVIHQKLTPGNNPKNFKQKGKYCVDKPITCMPVTAYHTFTLHILLHSSG